MGWQASVAVGGPGPRSPTSAPFFGGKQKLSTRPRAQDRAAGIPEATPCGPLL